MLKKREMKLKKKSIMLYGVTRRFKIVLKQTFCLPSILACLSLPSLRQSQMLCGGDKNSRGEAKAAKTRQDNSETSSGPRERRQYAKCILRLTKIHQRECLSAG